ncbi:hypothetical protein [Nocardia xishanensis]|uniref:hypothetical protein n=1 Tax=Nocardia xishanensis TaxID=238964 RepID=UPI0008336827|nr:hypothetical protein [Nocardia xishanensis]
MGHPDDLSPAERHQYLENYGPGKIAKGEIPKGVDRWKDANAVWRTNGIYGYTVARGLDIVLGLREAGWTPEVPHRADTGEKIVVDRHLEQAKTPDGIAANIEIKAGAIKGERDMAQLRGYADKLTKGERVILITREAREGTFSKEAREEIARLSQQYPQLFRVMKMNERVFQRVLEAGTRVVQKEQRQQLRDNLSRLPAAQEKEAPGRGIGDIARDYLTEITKAKEQGREVGIEQMRFVYHTLRDLDRAELRVALDKADERRQALGLRFHENREVEKWLELRALDAHAETSRPIDNIGHELFDRERESLDKAAREAHREIAQAREQGRALDIEQVRQQHVALGNTYAAVQKMERKMFEELSRGLPDPPRDSPLQSREEWLLGMKLITDQRDKEMVSRIDGLGEIAKREQEAREARAQHQALERDAIERGMDPMVARVLGLNHLLPGEEARRVERDADPDHRSRMAAERAAREQRERDRQRGIERGPS